MKNLILLSSASALVAAVFTWFGQGEASAKDSERTGTVHVGVIGTVFRDLPEPMFNMMMSPLKALVETQTGLNGKMVAGGNAYELARQLAENKVQVAYFHGFEFAWARRKYPELKPLVVAVNPTPCAQACVVTSKESTITRAADLKGKKLALANRIEEHCRLYVERHCCPPGDELKQFFDKIIATADQEEALDAVLDGRVDATVVDGAALENYAERKPGCFAKLKTLMKSEPFPWAVVACDPAHLDEATQMRFREGLIKATETRKGKQLLAICHIAEFKPIPKDYNKDLHLIIKAYPPLAEK